MPRPQLVPKVTQAGPGTRGPFPRLSSKRLHWAALPSFRLGQLGARALRTPGGCGTTWLLSAGRAWWSAPVPSQSEHIWGCPVEHLHPEQALCWGGGVAVQPRCPSEELALNKLSLDSAFPRAGGEATSEPGLVLLCARHCHPLNTQLTPSVSGPLVRVPEASVVPARCCCSFPSSQGFKLFLPVLCGHREVSDCSVCTCQSQDLL